eukprot:sb/3478655/
MCKIICDTLHTLNVQITHRVFALTTIKITLRPMIVLLLLSFPRPSLIRSPISSPKNGRIPLISDNPSHSQSRRVDYPAVTVHHSIISYLQLPSYDSPS